MAYNRLYSWVLKKEEIKIRKDIKYQGLDFVIKDQKRYDDKIKEQALANTILIFLTLVMLLLTSIYKIITLW